MNKRGWIEIVEAFVAILLIAGVALAVIEQRQAANNGPSAISSSVINSEAGILNQVEQNDSLRTELVNIGYSSLPLSWAGFQTSAQKTASLITAEIPGSFNCTANLCQLNSNCLFTGNQNQTVYSSSSIISSSTTTYSPRILKLFCWKK